jgi:branched-chain amino acid transport system ATP-binding protein
LTKIYSGRISYDGLNLVGMPPHEVTHRGIAYLPQTENVFSNLKVRENLTMAGYPISNDVFQERAKEVVDLFPFLRDCRDRRAGTLSGGERQMLAMAMALIKKPRVMMFDEPTASLAPKVVVQVLDQIARLRKEQGMTIILAEQNARKALEYGDQALLLVNGQIAFQGATSDLFNHRDLGKLYLGLKDAEE